MDGTFFKICFAQISCASVSSCVAIFLIINVSQLRLALIGMFQFNFCNFLHYRPIVWGILFSGIYAFVCTRFSNRQFLRPGNYHRAGSEYNMKFVQENALKTRYLRFLFPEWPCVRCGCQLRMVSAGTKPSTGISFAHAKVPTAESAVLWWLQRLEYGYMRSGMS